MSCGKGGSFKPKCMTVSCPSIKIVPDCPPACKPSCPSPVPVLSICGACCPPNCGPSPPSCNPPTCNPINISCTVSPSRPQGSGCGVPIGDVPSEKKNCGGCGKTERREKRWAQCNFLKPCIDTRIYRNGEHMCVTYAGHVPGEQYIHGRNLPTSTTFAKKRLCQYTPYEFVDPDGTCSFCTYP